MPTQVETITLARVTTFSEIRKLGLIIYCISHLCLCWFRAFVGFSQLLEAPSQLIYFPHFTFIYEVVL